jgi:serine-type D-Ala-D-Ala carboxypeptidase (penicillin-binding protein 5/6)
MRGSWSRSRLLPACLALLLVLTCASPAYARASVRRPVAVATTAPAPPAPPKAWVLVDADTGGVINAGNDRTPLPPASLTKVITAVAAIDSLAPGVNDIPVSARAAAMPADKISMKQGEVWTLTDTLHALLLSSANDAAVAIAERAGGTVEGFQLMFAATAANLGFADNPVLNDPAGLDGPQGVEGGNLVSARDLAMATRALLNQPTLAPIVATPIYYFTGPDGFHHRLTNHNKLFLTTYDGAIGVKTGYTRRAGACLIAAARRGGRTMLAVVMNGANPTLTAKNLLDQGFATPVNAEPAADLLPPVHLGTPTVAGQPVPTAAPPQTAPPARPVRRASSTSGIDAIESSWPGRLVIGALGLIGLLRLRAVLRGKRRRKVFQLGSGASRDRRAA